MGLLNYNGDGGGGSGNVTGPGSSVNNDIAIFSGTTGKVIADSGVNISTLSGGPFIPLAGGTMSAGNTGISNVTGFYDLGNVESLSTNTRSFFGNTGNKIGEWGRYGAGPLNGFGDVSGNIAIALNARIDFDSTAAMSLDWENRLLGNINGVTVIDYSDTLGAIQILEAVDFNAVILKDIGAIEDAGGTYSIEPNTRHLDDEFGVTNVLWNTSTSNQSFYIQQGSNASALTVLGEGAFVDTTFTYNAVLTAATAAAEFDDGANEIILANGQNAALFNLSNQIGDGGAVQVYGAGGGIPGDGSPVPFTIIGDSQIPLGIYSTVYGGYVGYFKGDGAGDLSFGGQTYVTFESGGLGAAHQTAFFTPNNNMVISPTLSDPFGSQYNLQVDNTVNAAYYASPNFRTGALIASGPDLSDAFISVDFSGNMYFNSGTGWIGDSSVVPSIYPGLRTLADENATSNVTWNTGAGNASLTIQGGSNINALFIEDGSTNTITVGASSSGTPAFTINNPNFDLNGAAVLNLFDTGNNALLYLSIPSGSGGISASGLTYTFNAIDQGNNASFYAQDGSGNTLKGPNGTRALVAVGDISTSGKYIAAGGNGATGVDSVGTVFTGGIATTVGSVATPRIVGNARMTGRTAAQALATLTVGASDTTFQVSANVNITAVAVASFQVTCTYTDETSTSRTLVLNFSQISGTLVQTLTAALGTGAYEGVPLQIRAKTGTTIIIASTGTFTSVTYNLEERIIQY